MKNHVYFPYFEFSGIPFFSLRKIKNAGFDGVEIHLVGHKGKDSVQKCIDRAQDLGLGVTLHQAWSLDENPTHSFNKVLDMFGYLPKRGYRLEDHLGSWIKEFPATVYADRWQELDENPNWRLQTSSHFEDDHSYRMSYREMVNAVTHHNLNVTFDTQHCLEVKLNVRGVEKIPVNKDDLCLLALWDDFSDHVREIHFADCNPKLGHSRGRNVFLDTGVLPLHEFARQISQQGWSGLLVPEVSPFILLRSHSLLELRRKMDEYFET